MGPPIDAPIGLRVVGTSADQPGFADLTTLRSFAGRLMDLLRSHPDTRDVHDTVGAPGYQLRVEIDDDRANLAGVTPRLRPVEWRAGNTGRPAGEFEDGLSQPGSPTTRRTG